MKRFEQLHAEDQLRLACQALAEMCAAQRPTIAKAAVATGRSELEFWQDVCAELGFDECEPWEGYPAGPKRENWAKAPGADRELTGEFKIKVEALLALGAELRNRTRKGASDGSAVVQ